MSRQIVWFSCGAASAVAAHLAVRKYPAALVVYCDLSKDEHQDNARFMADVSEWIQRPIAIIKSAKFDSVDDVFEKTGYMSGIKGARCSAEMKKIPRFAFQHPDDLHIFGYTAEEKKRIAAFEKANFDLNLEWPLRDGNFSKSECHQIIRNAGIETPAMYKLGFKNNNCMGCVKASSPGYWNLVREVDPATFQKRCEQSRRLGVRLVEKSHHNRIFLDELDPNQKGRYKQEDISCGPQCS